MSELKGPWETWTEARGVSSASPVQDGEAEAKRDLELEAGNFWTPCQ